jgi:hypothetical protein
MRTHKGEQVEQTPKPAVVLRMSGGGGWVQYELFDVWGCRAAANYSASGFSSRIQTLRKRTGLP